MLFKIRPFILLLMLLYPLNLFADNEIKKNDIPSAELYERIFIYNKNEEYDKIYKSLEYIKNIIDEINKKYSIDFIKNIEPALKDKNRNQIEIELKTLVYYDIKLNFDNSIELYSSPKKAISFVKAAAIIYVNLSQFIKSDDDEEIKSLFRKGYKLFKPKTPYSDMVSIKKDELEEIFNKIENLILNNLKLKGKYGK